MKKFTSCLVLLSFLFSCILPPQGFAQGLTAMGLMPEPGTMVALTAPFQPAVLKAMTIDPNDPFRFDFVVDRGDEQLTAEEKQVEYTKLIKYFLAALAVPDTDQWVNLSPYEQDRIIPDNFGLTEMGRDLLAQDYLLKQIASSLTNPDTELGRKFWDNVYARAYEKFGSTEIPAETFNKVWAVPDKAEIYEKGNMVYLVSSHLKVMLEKDYLSAKNNGGEAANTEQAGAEQISQAVMREVILPAIEKEINEGKSFAPVRQVYSGMLLAAWYKRTLKETILGKVYADQGKVKGIDQDPKTNQEIYAEYVEAFKKGVFNMIKEDTDRYSGEVIPRKYFSGGFKGLDLDFSQASFEEASNDADQRDKQLDEIKTRLMRQELATSEELMRLLLENVMNKIFVDEEGNKEGRKIKITKFEPHSFSINAFPGTKKELQVLLTELANQEGFREYFGNKRIEIIPPISGLERTVVNVVLKDKDEAQNSYLAPLGNDYRQKVEDGLKSLGIDDEGIEVNIGSNGLVVIKGLPNYAGWKTLDETKAQELIPEGFYLHGYRSRNDKNDKNVDTKTIDFYVVDEELKFLIDAKEKLSIDFRELNSIRYDLVAQDDQVTRVFAISKLQEKIKAAADRLEKKIAELGETEIRGKNSWLINQARSIVKVVNDFFEAVDRTEIRERNLSRYRAGVNSIRLLDQMNFWGEDDTSDFAETTIKGLWQKLLVGAGVDLRRSSIGDALAKALDGIEYTYNERGQFTARITGVSDKYAARDLVQTALAKEGLQLDFPTPAEVGGEPGVYTVIAPAVKKKETVVGGIDFAQSNLDLQIRRDGKGMLLPLDQQDLQNIRIDGLVPDILGIEPVTGAQLFH